MLFHSLAFAKFFAVVFVLSWLLARFRMWHVLFLVAASYVFYAGWDWRYLPLIFASSTIDFWLAARIDREDRPARRRAWLVGTVVLNLGLLGFFKYVDFGLHTAASALGALGVRVEPRYLELTLPVGISFFTFESMSYVVDVYRRKMPAYRSWTRYLLFVAFFPHLVAGPIVRPRDLLPQFERGPVMDAVSGSRGLFLVAVGLVKKVAIGDYLAANLVDRIWERPFEYSSLEVLFGVYGFAAQIYCDFSGYTDIAIGTALLLGYTLPGNFDRPYAAAGFQEFWRRWHISLSSWLRDYLYISVGGSRGSLLFTCRNLMITMLLGGLWHGARWTFVFWGLLHGAALVAGRVWSAFRGAGVEKGTGPAPPGSPWLRAARVALVFHFTCLTWIFFRSENFDKARAILSQLRDLTAFGGILQAPLVAAIAVGIGAQWLPEGWYARARDAFARLPAPAQAAALFGVAVVLREVASAKAVPFIYFQF